MKVRTLGDNPKFTRKELRGVIRFMGNLLFSPKLRENLFIVVHSKPSDKLPKDVQADCEYLDSNLKPRRFKIILNADITRDRMLEVLGHEMVHIRQYAMSELKWLHRFGPLKSQWRDGKIYEEVEGDDSTYLFLPWEIEARGYEEALKRAYYDYITAT
jgi:hypothetical protein